MHCRRAARYFSYVCCLATTVPLLLSCDMLMPSIDNQNDLSAQDQAGLDTDGDGKLDAVEGQGDDDGDGILNFQDANDEDGPAGDLDGDGIVNSQDSNNSNGPVGDPTNSGCVSELLTFRAPFRENIAPTTPTFTIYPFVFF